MLINNPLLIKLTYLKNHPEKVKHYAGTFHHNMFRPCKKCRGKGFIERLNDKNGIIGYFCSCVVDNIRQEINNISIENNLLVE